MTHPTESVTLRETGNRTIFDAPAQLQHPALYDISSLSVNANVSSPPDHHGPVAVRYTMLIVPPMLVILGTLGNILAAGVLARRRFTGLSTSVYLQALAVADTLYLWVNRVTLDWLQDVFGVHVLLSSDWACRTVLYLFYNSYEVSAWLVVAVTLERTLVVTLPHKAKAICTRRRAGTLVFLIVGAMLLVNAHIFFTMAIRETPEGRLCYLQAQYSVRTVFLLTMVDVSLYSFLPCLILFTSNLIIISRLWRQQRARSATLGWRCPPMIAQTRRVTLMLLSVSFTFLLTTLPICVVWTILMVGVYSGREYLDKDNIVMPLVRILDTTNHALNFVLYFLCGPTFRNEVACLLGCRPIIKNTKYGQGHHSPIAGRSPDLRFSGHCDTGLLLPRVRQTIVDGSVRRTKNILVTSV